MSKIKLTKKLLPIALIASVFLSACEIPDISKFTEQSAEMTRGIRKGVKDTESLIKSASERNDIYSDATRKKLRADLKNYQTAMKPTLNALDALDGYLEALNALSQANKKSGENAGAAVTAVGNLVTAVSGFTFATPVVNVATGLVTLEEQFRTAKDFKKRVTLSAEIVEGVHPKMGEDGKPMKDKDGRVIFEKRCTEAAADQIGIASNNIKEVIKPVMAGLTEEQIKVLKPLTPAQKRQQLKTWDKLSDAQVTAIQQSENVIASFGCGVIDLLKFNMQDLKEINLAVSQSMYDNIREKEGTVFGFHDNLVQSRKNIQDELENIQVVKNLVPVINEYIANGADEDAILTRKVRFKRTLDNLFLLDAPLKTSLLEAVNKCGTADCGKMQEMLVREITLDSCDAACVNDLKNAFKVDINKPQFDRSAGIIISVLDTRRAELTEQDEQYNADLERIAPAFDAVKAELKSIKDNSDKLDALLDSSVSALDAWAETHANLRVAVNTKKPLTVAKLASKVREIWGIINPSTT